MTQSRAEKPEQKNLILESKFNNRRIFSYNISVYDFFKYDQLDGPNNGPQDYLQNLLICDGNIVQYASMCNYWCPITIITIIWLLFVSHCCRLTDVTNILRSYVRWLLFLIYVSCRALYMPESQTLNLLEKCDSSSRITIVTWK